MTPATPERRQPDRNGFAICARLTPALLLAAVLVAVSLLTRIVLLLRTDTPPPSGPGALAQVFSRGLYFDLVAADYFVTPFLMWLALVPNRLAATRLHRILVLLGFAGTVYGLTVVAVAEWLFWEEFGARFNFIAVDYLLYTQEVIGNIRQSYPVGRIFAALALPALLVTWRMGRRLLRSAGAPLPLRARVAALAAHALLVAAAFGFADSDQKDFSASDVANELAGNGIYEFFAANYRNELNFEKFYATLPPDEALAQAKRAVDAAGEWLDRPHGTFERHVGGSPSPRRLNVVLVSIESMGAEFLDAYGNGKGLTPNLDRLARESLWFSNAYATGNRTVRGLEALALALPPTPGQSIVRRPKNERLFSLGSVFEDMGYDTLFAYGGYGYFDNMNAFFARNDYRAVDRTDIPREKVVFENIWGVADEILFDFVLDELDRQQQAEGARPFFVHIMTTSNHRPYSYPAGRIDIPSGSGRDGAVRYADWAIGHLLDEARKRRWFDDTLFVITADHGASARGTIDIPVDKYRIPVFFYAPQHIEQRRVKRLMSQIDIAPTLLGLLGAPYYSKFFGRDLLHAPPAGDRAFVANYQTLGYLRDGKMVVLQPHRKVSVFEVDADGHRGAPAEDPTLAREAIALYQAASIVFKSGRYRDEEQLAPATTR
ncbi:MAG: LTA synthase family protein [Betaproteobacteria bacterium]|nr:LTA synthase family protein [Betaproteobacteria bacterium]